MRVVSTLVLLLCTGHSMTGQFKAAGIALADGASSSPGVSSRFAIASGWLTDLCVLKSGTLQSSSLGALNEAFEAWRASDKLPTTCTPGPEPSRKEPNFSDMTLIPSLGDRLLRMAEFQAEGQQTPDYVYGVLENAPSGTQSTFLPNTDHGIFSYGGPVHFDELFVASDTRIALCTALGADKQPDPNGPQTYSPQRLAAIKNAHCDDEDYIATGRWRDHFARIGSSVTLNVRYSQIPLYESGVLISPQSTNLQKWSPTVTGSFDSSKLFRTAAELQALASYISTDKAFRHSSNPRNRFDVPYMCNRTDGSLDHDTAATGKCVADFAMGSKLQRTLLFILPVISVKVTTPFDLAKYGSTFEEPPSHSGRSLYDVSLTWNLHSSIPNAQTIAAGVKTLDTLYSSKAPSAPPADAEWRRQVKCLYMELKAMPQEADNENFWEKFREIVLHQQPDPKP